MEHEHVYGAFLGFCVCGRIIFRSFRFCPWCGLPITWDTKKGGD